MKTQMFDASKRKFCSLGALALAFMGFFNSALVKAEAKGDSSKPGEVQKIGRQFREPETRNHPLERYP